MDLHTEPVSHADLRQPVSDDSVLSFENVTVSFGEGPVLDGVSFRVERGHTHILFGAAGSGKSVLLKTAIGLLHPDAGRVCLFGQDISQMEEERLFEVRGKVGVLFQESGLFDSLNVEENVAYPILNQKSARNRRTRPSPEEVHRRVREALRFVELEHTLEKYPSELSGGMRRRVGIARAAVTEPPLMLYDSPTAGLDPITANTIMALVVKARDTRNTTSVIVTHRYQDGHIMANFRYNPANGELIAAPPGSGIHERTTFMVFREGTLVFEGTQEELEAATDPYVAKFKSTRSS
jgi:phospholipid/cholesterol/gamma-HCH transport system ATP-binding protein